MVCKVRREGETENEGGKEEGKDGRMKEGKMVGGKEGRREE